MQLAAWRLLIGSIATEMASRELAPQPLQNRLEFALARLWRAMQDLPQEVWNGYQKLDEDDLSDASSIRAAEYALADVRPWHPNLTGETEGLVREVAVELRALDQALRECRADFRSELPSRDFRAFGNDAILIIPKIHTPAGRRGQAFNRRGLRHHRIIPAEIEGLEVRLHCPSLSGPGMDGSPTSLLSAMFHRAELEIASVGADFRVERLTNEVEVSAALKDQLEELTQHGPCMAVAWPELMIPPQLLDQISNWLGGQGLNDEPADLGFLVAGSWHSEREGAHVNCATVIDGLGTPILEVIKHEPFELEAGKLEAIRAGKHLPILLYGDVLIAFAICKDFCDRRRERLYASLDVDLVIVPSLGNATTMGEHVQAAKTLSVGYGARCFVVQQLFDKTQPDLTWGLVLPPPEAPRSALGEPRPQDKLLDRTSISCTIT